MKHMTEEELIAFREGVVEPRAAISDHLAACQECRAELERIEAVLTALDSLPVPDPGADYGRRVWQQTITAGASGSRLLQGCRRNREHGGRRGSSRAGSL